jgi:L-iditol 2-dehydrogenase
MRVAVYHNNQDVRIVDREPPRIGPGELLVRIEASGICGSDVMESYRLRRAPLVLGHEIAGTVAEVGDGVDRFRPGDRVFATHHVPCGVCHRCQSGHPSTCKTLRETHFDPGGFAELVRVPVLQVERGTLLLPDDVTFEEGSFIEPLACVLQGQRYADLRRGQTVAVLGSGLAGLLHIQAAAVAGASQVLATDVHPFRLEAARSFGAHEAFDAADDVPGRIRASSNGRLADRVVVASGAAAAIRQAFQCVEPGGTILFFAPTDPGVEIPIPFFDVWKNEVNFVFSYAASGRDLEAALELIREHKVHVAEMISHRLPLAEAARGFSLTATATDSLKVILLPQK